MRTILRSHPELQRCRPMWGQPPSAVRRSQLDSFVGADRKTETRPRNSRQLTHAPKSPYPSPEREGRLQSAERAVPT